MSDQTPPTIRDRVAAVVGPTGADDVMEVLNGAFGQASFTANVRRCGGGQVILDLDPPNQAYPEHGGAVILAASPRPAGTDVEQTGADGISLIERARRYSAGVGTFSRAQIGQLAEVCVRGQAYQLGMEFFQEMATVLAASLLGDSDDHDLGAWVQALPPEKRNVLAQLLDALDVDLDDLDPSAGPKACVPVPCPEPETVEITGVVRLEDGAVFDGNAWVLHRKPWTFDVQFDGGPQRVEHGTGTEWDGSHQWAIYDGPHEIDDVVLAGAADEDPTAVLAQIVAEHNACICPPLGLGPTVIEEGRIRGVSVDAQAIDQADDTVTGLMDRLAESVAHAKVSLGLIEALRHMDALQNRTDAIGGTEIAWYHERERIERLIGVPYGTLDTGPGRYEDGTLIDS